MNEINTAIVSQAWMFWILQ